jgi:hypothetical protein
MNCVYLLESDGYYKIGVTSDLKERVSSLQTGNPHPIVIRDVIQTETMQIAYAIEKRFHLILSDSRVSGEWFKINDEELALFDGIFTAVMQQNMTFLQMIAPLWKSVVASNHRVSGNP